eukprot:jgi/Botrbrau1/22155/Bobra.0206s0078.1
MKSSLFFLAAIISIGCIQVIAAAAAPINDIYVLMNKKGTQVHLVPGGASIQRVITADRNGLFTDIALGFDDAASYNDYKINNPKFGCIVGRVVNRIKGASFVLDNVTYNLVPNLKGNALHGGAGKGWGDQVWKVVSAGADAKTGLQSVKFQYNSPDGDQKFPGNVKTTATYTLDEENKLTLVMEATTDAATPINLVNHAYFNLNGQANGTVLDHVLQVPSGRYYTLNDGDQITTGEFATTVGTKYDFLQPHTIGERFDAEPNPEPTALGYDLNYVLWNNDGPAAKAATVDCVIGPKAEWAATVYSPNTGRAMDLYTNAPGLQLYTGNHLDGTTAGKGNYIYNIHGGMALETQVFADFVHHNNFPQCILRPGQTYRHIWALQFYTHNGSLSGAGPYAGVASGPAVSPAASPVTLGAKAAVQAAPGPQLAAAGPAVAKSAANAPLRSTLGG